MRLGELARLEQISKSTMTRLVCKLEARNFINRWVDPKDGRVFLVTLTEPGARMLREARARQEHYLARQFDALDARDQAALLAAVSALERLLEVKA
jgi:DNA-binding MarR family transcriptional regulator